jgi:hypothetical protein
MGHINIDCAGSVQERGMGYDGAWGGEGGAEYSRDYVEGELRRGLWFDGGEC